MSGYKTPSEYKMADQMVNSNKYQGFTSSIDISSSLRGANSNTSPFNPYKTVNDIKVDSTMPYLSDRTLFSATTRQQQTQIQPLSHPQSLNQIRQDVPMQMQSQDKGYLSQFDLNLPQKRDKSENIDVESYSTSSFSYVAQGYNSGDNLGQLEHLKSTQQWSDKQQNNPIFNRITDPTFHRK